MALNRRVTIAMVPLLFPALGMTAGVAVGLFGGLACRSCLVPVVPLIVGVMAVAIGVWSIFGLKPIADLRRFAPAVAAAAMGVLAGIMAVAMRGAPVVEECRMGTVAGRVEKVAEYVACQKIVVRDLHGRNYTANVVDCPLLLETGDRVLLRGEIQPPWQEPTVPGQITGRRFAMANYLSGRVVLDKENGIEILAGATGIRGWLNGLRQRAMDAITYSGLNPGAADFLCAVLLGHNAVADDVRAEFAGAGMSHLLALSGTHVSSILFMLVFVLMPVEIVGGGRLRRLIVMALLWGYALLTGLSPSVVRAVTMASLVLLGRMSGRYVNTFNSLCGAAILILLVDPGALLNVGFQLSFVAVTGIVMFMPVLLSAVERVPERWRRPVRWMWAMIAITLCAVVATAPLAAWYFHFLPLWFLVANIPASFLLPPILAAGLMLLASGACGLDCSWVVSALDWMYGLLVDVARMAGSLPGNNAFSGIYFDLWLLIPAYLALLLLWSAWNNRRMSYAVNGLIFLVFAAAMMPIAKGRYPASEGYVWRTHPSVTVVVRSGAEVEILTDAAPMHYGEIAAEAEFFLADFLGTRRARLRRVSAGGGMQGVERPGGVLWRIPAGVDGARPFNCLVIGAGGAAPSPRLLRQADVVMLSRGYKGEIADVRQLAADLGGRPIVLSPTLSPKRRERFAAYLDDAGYTRLEALSVSEIVDNR